jgi:hypothetical protein
MSNVKVLKEMFQDFQVGGKFEKKEVLALLVIMRDMAERLERVERACEIRSPD